MWRTTCLAHTDKSSLRFDAQKSQAKNEKAKSNFSRTNIWVLGNCNTSLFAYSRTLESQACKIAFPSRLLFIMTHFIFFSDVSLGLFRIQPLKAWLKALRTRVFALLFMSSFVSCSVSYISRFIVMSLDLYILMNQFPILNLNSQFFIVLPTISLPFDERQRLLNGAENSFFVFSLYKGWYLNNRGGKSGELVTTGAEMGW